MKRPTDLKLQLFMTGCTQAEIARKADVSIACINRIVWNKDKPSAKVKKAFCEVTGLSEQQLFGGEKQKAS